MRYRLPVFLAWIIATVVVMAGVQRLVPVVRDQLVAPFDLNSEGPHLGTIKAIREGFNIYDPSAYLDLPYFLTPYAPLYHLAVAHLPADPENPFFTGRLVAMIFMLAAVASLFWVAPRGSTLAVPLLASGSFLLIHPVTGNTAYLRSDSMALCYATWAVVLLARAPGRPRRVVASAILAVLAIAAKQQYVAAATACFVFLLLRDRRLAATFAAVAIVAAAAFAGAAWLAWGNGFWFCLTLPITTYPRDWESFGQHWTMMLRQPIFDFVVASGAAVLLWRAVVEGPLRLLCATPYPLYALLAWAMATSVMTGVGAENHNFIEAIFATLLWIVFATGVTTRLAPWRLALASLVAVACVGAEITSAPRATYSFTTPALTADYVRDRALVREQLRALGSPRPRLLNLKNSGVTHDFEGEMAVNDPFMFIVLWESGRVSTAPLLRALAARRFDAIIVSPGVVSAANQRADEPVQNVIRTAFDYYDVHMRARRWNVLTPRGLSSPAANGRLRLP